MSLENARRDLLSRGFAHLIVHHETGIATVQDAAATIGWKKSASLRRFPFCKMMCPCSS